MRQVAIYCRASTDDRSCERQERDLRAFARRGHKIVGVFKERAKNGCVERQKVMALAQAGEIDAILVTDLSRWGRSTQDLVQTLDELHSCKVSLLAQTGLSSDLNTATGKLMCSILAGLAQFERNLFRDRVMSGHAVARARGVALGRPVGQRPSEKYAGRVRAMLKEGLSYRRVARKLGISKNTVMVIARRAGRVTYALMAVLLPLSSAANYEVRVIDHAPAGLSARSLTRRSRALAQPPGHGLQPTATAPSAT